MGMLVNVKIKTVKFIENHPLSLSRLSNKLQVRSLSRCMTDNLANYLPCKQQTEEISFIVFY